MIYYRRTHDILQENTYMIYYRRTYDIHAQIRGVAIVATQSAMKACMEWNPVSPRIITARFKSIGRKVSVIQCYAPTNGEIEEEAKEALYNRLHHVNTKERHTNPNGRHKCKGGFRQHRQGRNNGKAWTLNHERKWRTVCRFLYI